MSQENIIVEYKSLSIFLGEKANLKKLAWECVCMANAQGGIIRIGFESKESEPPSDQRIDLAKFNSAIRRLKGLFHNTAITHTDVLIHQNGGQYFEITIFPSINSIATTSEGRISIRIGEDCLPIKGEDIQRLAIEKNSFQWELVQMPSVSLENVNKDEIHYFVESIRNSSRVKPHVKEKGDSEILEHYKLILEGRLTNLGILWLGFPAQRAKILYPVTLQYIVYDEQENKVQKISYSDLQLNPKQLLLDIEKEAVELTYFHEFSRGLLREKIPLYPQKVIRELLVNAIAHQSYTISGDIFIEVFVDRLEISNPGGLPLGITNRNILHQRHRRNPHLMSVLHDMELMEGEGSGYDLIYEINSRLGKPFPRIESDFNSVRVIQDARVLDENVLELINYVGSHFQLKQKEFITLGIIAREKKIQTTDLTKILQLDEDRFRNWIGKLVDFKIVTQVGTKKGAAYLINPKLISDAKLNIKPSLKTMEPYRLKALIEEDLKAYSSAKISEIHSRLDEVDIRDIKKYVYQMVSEGLLSINGAKKNRVYSLAKNK